MVKKILKIAGYILGSIILIAGITYIYAGIDFSSRAKKSYDVKVRDVEVITDSASLLAGKHLSVIKACQECHGSNLAGRVVFDDPAVGLIASANLTRGKGGIGQDYTDQDWVKAIRHGVNRHNKPLFIMPSQEFNGLSDVDLASLIAYCKSVEPVDNEIPENELRPLGKMLVLFDKIQPFSAEIIDHAYIQPKEVHKEISADYGKYLSVTCQGCHKPDFHGGDSPVPGFPPPPNITASGRLKEYSENDFMTTLQTGVTPDGRQLNNEFMPWEMTKSFTEDEIKSLYLYLNSLQ